MAVNPYSPPTSESNTPTSRTKVVANVLLAIVLAILKFGGGYLLGILACVSFTSVEFELAGVNQFSTYFFFSVVGVGVWFVCALQEASPPFEVFWVVIVLLIPCALEASAYFARPPRLGRWRPMWIGFPIGFIGPVGIYWACMLSI